MTDSRATVANVFGAINEAVIRLEAGDVFLVSYAGHGIQKDDSENDELDHMNESWVLFDGLVIDDRLAVQWRRFKPGVRIVFVSDSCHAGSSTGLDKSQIKAIGGKRVFRAMSDKVLAATLAAPRVWQG